MNLSNQSNEDKGLEINKRNKNCLCMSKCICNTLLASKYNKDYITMYENYIIENPDKADIMYKKDLLELFSLTDNDEFDIINERIQKLYIYIKDTLNIYDNDYSDYSDNINNNKFIDLLKKSASRLLSEDLETGFLLLYSYDTLYLIHKLIKQILLTNTINETIINEIISKF